MTLDEQSIGSFRGLGLARAPSISDNPRSNNLFRSGTCRRYPAPGMDAQAQLPFDAWNTP